MHLVFYLFNYAFDAFERSYSIGIQNSAELGLSPNFRANASKSWSNTANYKGVFFPRLKLPYFVKAILYHLLKLPCIIKVILYN